MDTGNGAVGFETGLKGPLVGPFRLSRFVVSPEIGL